MNINSDMNDITIDYYRVENFNDINSLRALMYSFSLSTHPIRRELECFTIKNSYM